MAEQPLGRDALHLNLHLGRDLTRPAPPEIAEALLSAQITATAGERSGFQLAFDYTKNGPLARRYVPERYFHPKTRIVLTTTLRGKTTVLFDGLITRQEVGSSNRPGQSTLTVTGEDILDRIIQVNQRLSDPRGLSDAQARQLAKQNRDRRTGRQGANGGWKRGGNASRPGTPEGGRGGVTFSRCGGRLSARGTTRLLLSGHAPNTVFLEGFV